MSDRRSSPTYEHQVAGWMLIAVGVVAGLFLGENQRVDDEFAWALCLLAAGPLILGGIIYLALGATVRALRQPSKPPATRR